MEDKKKHQLGFFDGKSNKMREVAQAASKDQKKSPLKEAQAAVAENIDEKEE